MNRSELSRKEQVRARLLEDPGAWVDGPELANERVGGSEGLKRLRELRSDLPAEGLTIESRKHPDADRDVWQYRIVPLAVVSPVRSPGRYVPPGGDPGCPIHGSTCRKVWHREDPPKPDCSCGEGPVGHSTTHTSTDKPGVVRISREGKTDQYMNVAATRAASVQAQAVQSREDEIARQKATPRVDPRSHRLTFGGPVLCRRCGGTGGTLWEGCFGCGGTGLT